MKKIFSRPGIFRKKAQLSMEFVIFMAVSMVIMVSFLYIMNERESEIKERKQSLLVKDLAYKIQSELDTASIVEDGYSRNFTIPSELEGLKYNIFISNGILSIISNKSDVSIRIPDVSGSIKTGSNAITKKNGKICINLNTSSCV